MPIPTLTAIEHRIAERLDEIGEHRSRSAIQRLARRIHGHWVSESTPDPDQVVLTYLSHGRSVPVDSTVGEAVARKLTSGRT